MRGVQQLVRYLVLLFLLIGVDCAIAYTLHHVYHMGISFLFGIQGAPGGLQEEPGGARRPSLACFGAISLYFGWFPWVSDGPMVRELSN